LFSSTAEPPLNLPGAILLFRAGLAGHNITLGGTSAYTHTGQTQIFSNLGSIMLGMDDKLLTLQRSGKMRAAIRMSELVLA
jgi:hypothetical protein